MNDITINQNDILFNDNEGLIRAWLKLSNAQASLKRLKADLDQYIIDYFKENKISAVEMDGEWILKVGNKKKEIYKTQEIYDMFGFTEIQRKLLPKNPRFSKTALKSELSEEELKEYIDTKWEDTVEVKEIEKKYIK